MTIQSAKIMLSEFNAEVRAGFSGPLLYTVIAVLFFFTLFALADNNYIRESGGAGLPRNSQQIAYLLISGQALWLLFLWAYTFGRTASRDHDLFTQELVLASPVSLRKLLVARFFGSLLCALTGALAIPGAIIATPLLPAIGMVDYGSVAATPWRAIFYSALLFTIPGAIGLGALYYTVGILRQSIAMPFIVSTCIAFIWMFCIVALEGNQTVSIAVLLDPTGFTTVKTQTDLWTPAMKTSADLSITPAFFWNRLLWVVLPLVVFTICLFRIDRDRLLKGSRDGKIAKNSIVDTRKSSSETQSTSRPLYQWQKALTEEAAWPLVQLLRTRGFQIAIVLLSVMCIFGGYINFVGQTPGPVQPRLEATMPFLIEFFYIVLIAVLSGFIGLVVQRDKQAGVVEMIGATPAPIGVRLGGQAICIVLVTAIIASSVAVAGALLSLVSSSAPEIRLDAFLYVAFAYLPSLLQIAFIIFALHHLVKQPSLAYGLSACAIFIIILNSELSLVEYPHALIGVPTPLVLSAFDTWAPIWSYLLISTISKLAFCGVLFSFVWAITGRQTSTSMPITKPAFLSTALLSLGFLVVTHTILYKHIVTKGGFTTAQQEEGTNIIWEKTWWSKASSFELKGGSIVGQFEPAKNYLEVEWQLDGLSTQDYQLHGTLPNGVELKQITINERSASFSLDGDHFVIDTSKCKASMPCTLTMNIEYHRTGWEADGSLPMLHSTAAYLRAEDFLPRLGHDPTKLLKDPVTRENSDLPKRVPTLAETDALIANKGVAPKGRWQWKIAGPEGWHSGMSGQANGNLDFAFAWRATGTSITTHKQVSFILDSTRISDANAIGDSINSVAKCVADNTGILLDIQSVVQTFRGSKATLSNGVLYLPEDTFLDIEGISLGQQFRQYLLAGLMVEKILTEHFPTRSTPLDTWRNQAFSGAIGLACSGVGSVQEYIAIRAYLAEQLQERMATTGAPITSVLESTESWREYYAALSLDSVVMGRTDWSFAHALSYLQKTSTEQAIERLFDDETRARLLGSPVACDVAIESRSYQSVLALSRRKSWQGQGWQDIEEAKSLTGILDLEENVISRRFSINEPVPNQALIIIDPSGCFEATMEDNNTKRSNL